MQQPRQLPLLCSSLLTSARSNLLSQGRCQCFRGYEGADCSVAAGTVAGVTKGGDGGSQLNAERCGGRCAGVCLSQCRGQLEGGSNPSLGRKCYSDCSRTCLASCIVHRARDGAAASSDLDVAQIALPTEPKRSGRATGAGAALQPAVVVEAEAGGGGHGAAVSSAVAGLERQAVDELSQLLASLNKK